MSLIEIQGPAVLTQSASELSVSFIRRPTVPSSLNLSFCCNERSIALFENDQTSFQILVSEGSDVVLDKQFSFSWNEGPVREMSRSLIKEAVSSFGAGGSLDELRDSLRELESAGLVHQSDAGLFRREEFPEVDLRGLNDEAALLKLLLHFEVPVFELWGRNRARSFQHLINELEAGETRLTRDGDQLVLKTRVARIDVFYRNQAGELLHLQEEKQIFRDARREVRRNLDVSLGEKFLPSERSNEAAVRGVIEELFRIHVENDPSRRTRIAEQLELHGGELSATSTPSECYPGLRHDKVFTTYSVTLHPELFEPEGYIEHQSDKDTVFLWKLVKDPAQGLRIAI